MRTIENIRTALALFIVKYATKLADFIQPPYKRVKINKGILAMVTRPLPDLSVEHRKFSPMADPVEIDRSELAKAIKTASPITTDSDQESSFLTELVRSGIRK